MATRKKCFQTVVVFGLPMLLMFSFMKAQQINLPGAPLVPEGVAAENPSSDRVSFTSHETMTTASTMNTFNLESDSLALVDLYSATNGSQWIRKNNWLSGRLSTWYGITLSNGRITQIRLQNNNLTGEIPATIGNLTSLNLLFLNENSLTGQIPSSIGDLTLLNYLYLFENNLTGDLPSSIGNLTNLRYLAFHLNNLTGNFDWIGNLTELIEFWFYGNPNLACSIPFSIGNLAKLTSLMGCAWVDNTTGEGQPIYTSITGSIPSSIGNCSSLRWIYLCNNDLSGDVPNTISNLTSLKGISLQNTSLTGNLNLFASNLNNLEILYTFNSQVGGTIPANVNTSKLVGLGVKNSNVRAPIPPLNQAVNLLWLSLGSVELSEIPDWSNSFPNLYYLNVSNNYLTHLPNFFSHVNRSNLDLEVYENKLDFDDLEPSFSSPGVHPFYRFAYSPQNNPVPVPSEITVSSGEELTIEAPIGGTHGVYLWEKFSNGTWLNVSNQNESTTPNYFTIANVTPEAQGAYRYTVTNTWVPYLQFESGPIQVIVTDDGINGDYNWIKESTILVEGIKTEGEVENLKIQDGEKGLLWNYFDGLGRPMQSINVKASSGKKDIIKPIIYDEFGREAFQYLPFVPGQSSGFYFENPVGPPGSYNTSSHYNFYNNGSTAIAQDTHPFSETKFEPSPLNRILKQGAPGITWQPNTDPSTDRSLKKEYVFNATNEVLLFTYDIATEQLSVKENDAFRYYAANQLYANKTIDEHNSEVVEFIDKEGKTILKKVQYKEENGTKRYAETYYVYDDFGNLVVVLPPEAVRLLFAEN